MNILRRMHNVDADSVLKEVPNDYAWHIPDWIYRKLATGRNDASLKTLLDLIMGHMLLDMRLKSKCLICMYACARVESTLYDACRYGNEIYSDEGMAFDRACLSECYCKSLRKVIFVISRAICCHVWVARLLMNC